MQTKHSNKSTRKPLSALDIFVGLVMLASVVVLFIFFPIVAACLVGGLLLASSIELHFKNKKLKKEAEATRIRSQLDKQYFDLERSISDDRSEMTRLVTQQASEATRFELLTEEEREILGMPPSNTPLETEATRTPEKQKIKKLGDELVHLNHHYPTHPENPSLCSSTDLRTFMEASKIHHLKTLRLFEQWMKESEILLDQSFQGVEKRGLVTRRLQEAKISPSNKSDTKNQLFSK